jgi:hypothetical protein
MNTDEEELGRDGALRRPRRVQWRNRYFDSYAIEHLFSPLNAGWDGAARHPYQTIVTRPKRFLIRVYLCSSVVNYL